MTRRTEATGRIKNIFHAKSFGFVRTDAGEDFFFHKSAVEDGSFDTLQENMLVKFEVGQGAKGPRAESVRVLNA